MIEFIIGGFILGACIAYVLWYIKDKLSKLP